MKYKNSIFFLVIAIALASCADVKEDITVNQSVGIHPPDYGVFGKPNNHAVDLRNSLWDLNQCKTCHASDYSGGVTGSSCLSCHTYTYGPEQCNTCHGVYNDTTRIAPPSGVAGDRETTARGVGAHQVHLYNTRIAKPAECAECHQVPITGSNIEWHIDGQPAELLFGFLSTPSPPLPAPVYDYGAISCSNTYCHGNFEFLRDTSSNQFIYTADRIVGNNYSPIWNKVDGTQAACGTCHSQADNMGNMISIAPVGHMVSDLNNCANCHYGVVNDQGEIIDSTKHINKKINVFGN